MLHIRMHKLLVIVLGITYFATYEASEMRLGHYEYPHRSVYQLPQTAALPPLRGELGAGFSPGHTAYPIHADIQQTKNYITTFAERIGDYSYLESAIAEQTAQINRLPHAALEANGVRLKQELSTLHENFSEAQYNEYQLLGQMHLPFSTTILTPEQEARVHPGFLRAYYNNKVSMQNSKFHIVQQEQLLQHNEARMKRGALELSRAEEAFKAQIPDSRLYEPSSVEMVRLEGEIKKAEQVIVLQQELDAIKEAIKEIDHIYMWWKKNNYIN